MIKPSSTIGQIDTCPVCGELFKRRTALQKYDQEICGKAASKSNFDMEDARRRLLRWRAIPPKPVTVVGVVEDEAEEKPRVKRTHQGTITCVCGRVMQAYQMVCKCGVEFKRSVA